MSKLKRLLGALSLVALFIFSSCVDDEVAPEVAALRQAQVDLLNADVAYRNADTRWRTAYAEAQEITNSYESASNAIKLATEAAEGANDVAQAELLMAQAEDDLITAQKELAVATADLERYLATAGLADAAAYLADWNAVVLGGFMADGLYTGDGLLRTQEKLIDAQTELAVAQLFLNADSSATQAYVDAKLTTDLADLEAGLSMKEAALVANTAALAALQADDRFAAIEALQAQLVTLTGEDSIAAVNAYEAAKDARAAVGGEIDAATVVKDTFETYIDIAANYPTGNGTYRVSADDSILYAGEIAALAKDTVAYYDYADSLQAIYDEFYPVFVEDYETTLSEYEADTVETWNNLPSANAGQDELYTLEDAYAAYMIEWGLFVAKANDSNNGELPGLPPTTADTTALVAARTAFDGLNAAQMLNTPRDGSWNTANGIGMWPGGDFGEATGLNTWLNPPTALKGARDGGIGLGNGVGGALADYITASGNDGTAERLHNDAIARWTAVDNYYGNLVREYRALDAYIDSVNAGTAKNGLYVGTVPSEPLSITDFDGIPFIAEYNSALTGAKTKLQASLSKATDIPDCADLPFTACTAGIVSSAGANSSSISNALAKITTAQGNLKTAQEDLAYAKQIVAPYLEDYLAALETLNRTTAVVEAEFLALVPLDLAVRTTRATLDAVVAELASVRADIAMINGGLCDYEIDGSGTSGAVNPDDVLVTCTTVSSVISDLKASIAAAPAQIQADKDAIEAKNVEIALAAQSQIKAEDMIVIIENEITALETQEAVLQAMADELQALVLAALAG